MFYFALMLNLQKGVRFKMFPGDNPTNENG